MILVLTDGNYWERKRIMKVPIIEAIKTFELRKYDAWAYAQYTKSLREE
jgi:hypothetical protein